MRKRVTKTKPKTARAPRLAGEVKLLRGRLDQHADVINALRADHARTRKLLDDGLAGAEQEVKAIRFELFNADCSCPTTKGRVWHLDSCARQTIVAPIPKGGSDAE